MRLVTVALILLACYPMSVSGGSAEESTIEELHQAQADLDKANAELQGVEAEMRAETVDREEEPKQGNLRGTTTAKSATDLVIVDETEAKEAQAEALKALANNEFREAEHSMAKFFEFKELRATRMRAESTVLDEEQQHEAIGP